MREDSGHGLLLWCGANNERGRRWRSQPHSNHPGETPTLIERLFDVKENIERVFAPNA